MIRRTLRSIKGQIFVCIDVGCPDFERAATNRQMVANGECAEAYIRIEQWLREHPKKNTPLPEWIPLGTVAKEGGRRD